MTEVWVGPQAEEGWGVSDVYLDQEIMKEGTTEGEREREIGRKDQVKKCRSSSW